MFTRLRVHRHIQQHAIRVHQSDMASLPHKRHRRPLHNRHPHPVRQKPHHRRMRHPRQPLQLRPPLLQRNRKDIPVHVPAKDPQQLRPRHMRVPFKFNRRRRRNHKPFIVQQVALRHQIHRRSHPKTSQQHKSGKDPAPLRRRQPTKSNPNPAPSSRHRRIVILKRIVRKILNQSRRSFLFGAATTRRGPPDPEAYLCSGASSTAVPRFDTASLCRKPEQGRENRHPENNLPQPVPAPTSSACTLSGTHPNIPLPSRSYFALSF